ncbi:hypothetical protein Tco_0327303 [Tanacetum coccineum]
MHSSAPEQWFIPSLHSGSRVGHCTEEEEVRSVTFGGVVVTGGGVAVTGLDLVVLVGLPLGAIFLNHKNT